LNGFTTLAVSFSAFTLRRAAFLIPRDCSHHRLFFYAFVPRFFPQEESPAAGSHIFNFVRFFSRLQFRLPMMRAVFFRSDPSASVSDGVFCSVSLALPPVPPPSLPTFVLCQLSFDLPSSFVFLFDPKDHRAPPFGVEFLCFLLCLPFGACLRDFLPTLDNGAFPFLLLGTPPPASSRPSLERIWVHY